MNHQRKSRGLLAVVVAVVAMALFCLAALAVVGVALEYQAGKRASRERSIRVMKQIEAREAAQRDAELSIEPPDSGTGFSNHYDATRLG